MRIILDWVYNIDITSEWLQAFSSLLLVLVTIVYVIATKKISQQGAPLGWLEPCNFERVYGQSIDLKIKNYGPGHAVSIKILLTPKMAVFKKLNRGSIYSKKNKLKMKGHGRILEGEIGIYICEAPEGSQVFMCENMNLVIEWRSVSGLKIKKKWQFKKDKNGRFNWNLY